MKKILAILLAFCLVFSVVGTTMFVSAEGETSEEDGNIEVSKINTGIWYSGGWGHTAVSAKEANVYDNVFYSKAARFSVTDLATFKFGNVYPYYNNKVTGNELKDFVANHGDMRTYVKNTSGHDMTFKVGIKIKTTNDKPSAWKEQMKTVTIAGDSKWHEVRISFDDWGITEGSNWYKVYAGDDTDEFGFKEFYFFVSGLDKNDFTATTDELYFTKLEVYNGPLTGAVDDGANNANREITRTALINKASGNDVSGITAKEVGVYDNEYYTKAMKYYGATTGYKIDAKENSFVYSANSVSGDEFVDFMKYRGDMRTYVKNVSDHEMNFKLGVKVQYNGTAGSGYPSALQDVSVPNDGKWHEIRLSYSAFKFATNTTIYSALSGQEGYPIKAIWMRVSELDDDFKTETDELYFTPLEVYNRAIVGTPETEKSDANVKLKQLAVIDVKEGVNASGIQKGLVRIGDNKFYRTAMKYYGATVGNYSFDPEKAYVYSKSAPKDPADSTKTIPIDLSEFVKHHGVMRTYVKNTSGHDMTFNIGIKIQAVKGGYPSNVKEVTIPGDGKWHEVRISFDDLSALKDSGSQLYQGFAGGVYAMWMRVSGLDDDFTSATDALYFTPLEIYNRSIEEPLTTDFAREYIQSGLFTGYNNTKADDKTLTHNNTTYTGEKLPFFTKVVSYTKVEGSTAKPGGQSGYASSGTINTSAKVEAFADWYYNDNAELRLWIKTDKDTEIDFGILISGGGVYPELAMNPIQVKGSPDWQEIIIKRSVLTSDSRVETILNNGSFTVNLFFRATANTFVNTNQIHLSQAVEFYSDKAYAKGDTNCDNNVDVIDLVRIKKQAASTNVNLVNGDIDNNAAVNAKDLALIRKRLLLGKWN